MDIIIYVLLAVIIYHANVKIQKINDIRSGPPNNNRMVARKDFEISFLKQELEKSYITNQDLKSHIKDLEEIYNILDEEHNALKDQKSETDAYVDLLMSQETAEACATSDIISGKIKNIYTALLILNILYEGKIVILPSAWSSAKSFNKFNNVDKAFALLIMLCDNYANLIQGKGDFNVFPRASYAPRESETVEGNKGAVSRRTFVYNGKSIKMFRHLKVGSKQSRNSTWRCHFAIHDKKIIIGHCGRHLDFK